MALEAGDKVVIVTDKPSSEVTIGHYLKAGTLATITYVRTSFGFPYKYTVEAFGRDFLDTDKRIDSPDELFSQYVHLRDIKPIRNITKPFHEEMKNGDLPNI